MKLRAFITFDADCDGFLAAAEWQKKVEQLSTNLGKDFENVKYDIKVRRDREETTARRRGASKRKA